MSSDSDNRVTRAVEKYAKSVEQQSERKKLSGIANGTEEKKRANFLVAFAEKIHEVIEPALRRNADTLNTLSHRWPDDAEGARRSVWAEVNISDDEDQIALAIGRGDESPALSFGADALRMTVVVASSVDRISTELTLDQLTDDGIGGFIAAFVEEVLSNFALLG